MGDREKEDWRRPGSGVRVVTIGFGLFARRDGEGATCGGWGLRLSSLITLVMVAVSKTATSSASSSSRWSMDSESGRRNSLSGRDGSAFVSSSSQGAI